jgi:hypothetical protein
MPIVFMAGGNANPRSLVFVLLIMAFLTIINSLLHFDDYDTYDDYQEEISKPLPHTLAMKVYKCDNAPFFRDITTNVRNFNPYQTIWYYLMHGNSHSLQLFEIQARVFTNNINEPYTGVVRYFITNLNDTCTWSQEYEHNIDGRVRFAQKSADGECIHIVYDSIKLEGLSVTPQVKTFCIRGSVIIKDWPIEGTVPITALTESGSCLRIARKGDYYEYRTICDNTVINGPSAERISFFNSVVAIHDIDEKQLVILKEQGTMDDMLHSSNAVESALSQLTDEKHKSRGVSLLVRAYNKNSNGKWTPSEINYSYKNAYRKDGPHELRDSYYFGRTLSAQAANSSTVTMALQDGNLIILSPKSEPKLVRLPTKFTSYMSRTQYIEHPRYPSRRYMIQEITRTLNSIIEQQRLEDVNDLPKILILTPNGKWIGVSSDESKRILIAKKTAKDWKIDQTIVSEDFIVQEEHKTLGLFSSLFGNQEQQKLGKKNLRIVEANFQNDASLIALLEDGKIGVFNLDNKSLQNSEPIVESEIEDHDISLLHIFVEIVRSRWKMILLVALFVTAFVYNEIRIRQRIEVARQQQQQQPVGAQRPHSD